MVCLLCSVCAELKYKQQSFSLAFSHSGPRAVLLHLVLIILGSFALVRLQRWLLFCSSPAPRPPPLSILPEDS